MHKLAVIRSLSHANANHVQASLAAMTGHSHPPSTEARGDFPPSSSDFPPFGAVLSQLRQSTPLSPFARGAPGRVSPSQGGAGLSPLRKGGMGGSLPTWVQVGPLMRRNNGTVLHGQIPGFLGVRHSPLAIDQDLLPADVRVEAVATDPQVPVMRLTDRGRLRDQVEQQRRGFDRPAELQTFDAFQRRAFALLSGGDGARLRAGCGTGGRAGAATGRRSSAALVCCCRRLAEAGVPIVNVHFCHTPAGSWDTHGQHFSQMKNALCPIFDQAFTALVDDLDQRGLLDTTLVLATAEFSRTPAREQRRWARSLAMGLLGRDGRRRHEARHGLRRLRRHRRLSPRSRTIRAILAATVYHLLGVPADTMVHDPHGRPHALVIGRKIDGLLA